MSAVSERPGPSQAVEIEANVDAVICALRALGTLLMRERDAIGEHRAPRVLDSIALDRQAAIAHVAGLFDLLHQAMAAGHDGARRVSLARLEAARPGLGSRIDEMVVLTRDCQRVGRENAALAGARERHTAPSGPRTGHEPRSSRSSTAAAVPAWIMPTSLPG